MNCKILKVFEVRLKYVQHLKGIAMLRTFITIKPIHFRNVYLVFNKTKYTLLFFISCFLQ